MSHRKLTAPAFLLAMLFVVSSTFCTASEQTTNTVPPGFEALLAPQTTLIDVYYGGRFLASTLATFSLDTLRFHSPDDVIGQIPGILDRQKILARLSEAMPVNTHLLCQTQYQAACGVLEPELVGVIFDESRYSATLFIAQDALSVAELSIQKYLPAATVRHSFIHGVSFVYSDQNNEASTYNIDNLSVLGLGESRLRMFSNYSVNRQRAEKKWQIDSISLDRDYRGHSQRGGVFSTNYQIGTFLPADQLLGLGVSSHLDTRNDLDFAEGVALEIFLTTQSRVEIYKDGRLLSSGFYEAGNQQLDTRRLPNGAYNVVIRVIDSLGREQEESRFYVKSNRLPPVDQPSYFINFGKRPGISQEASTLPEFSGDWLFAAGGGRRLTGQLGMELGVAVVDSHSMLEVGSFWLGSFYDLSLSLARSDNDERGIDIRSHFHWQRSALTLSYQEVDGPESLVREPFTILSDPFKQYGANLSIPIAHKFRLSLSGRINERENVPQNTNYFASLDVPSFALWGVDFRLRFDWSAVDSVKQVQASITLLNHRKGMSSSISSENIIERDANNMESHFSRQFIDSRWSDQDLLASELQLNANYSRDENSERLGLRGDWDSLRGGLDFSAQQTHTAIGHNRAQSMSGRTTVLANNKGWALGGSEITQSAIVIDIQGSPKGALFDVLINGAIKGYAKVGARTVINVRPFQTYEVEVIAQDKRLINYEQAVHQVTVYPGNVKTLVWNAYIVDVVLGSIHHQDGTPVENALIEGVSGLAVTDERGFFQAELARGTKTLRVNGGDFVCELRVPRYTAKNQIANLGALVCLPLP